MDPFERKTTGMQAESIEELTCNYKALGIEARRQIDKKVLKVSGNGTIVAFLFSDVGAKGELGPKCIMIASFKFTNNVYKRHNYCIIRGKEQADSLSFLLKEWFDDEDLP